MKQIRWIGIILTAGCLFFSYRPAAAQDSDFERWQQQQEEAYRQFVDDEQARFADFLRRQWSSFEAREAETRDDVQPKPVEAPVAPDPDEPESEPEESPDVEPDPDPGPPSPGRMPSMPPQLPPVPFQEIPEPEPSTPVEAELPPELQFEWHYYKAPLPQLDNVQNFSLPRLSNEAIADAWLEMAAGNYKEVIRSLKDFARDKNLNDWAYTLLVKDYSAKVFSSHNEAVFLTWFLLHNSGFHANAGYTDNRLHLLMPVSERLYHRDYYELSGELSRFYVMRAGHYPDERPGAIRTYEPEADGSLNVLPMALTQAPAPSVQSDLRQLRFTFEGEEYRFDLNYDKAFTSLLARFPVMEPEYFFRAPASQKLHEQLERQLRPILDEMSEGRALNFLLRFSQTAFEYQTDTDQFGHQKYMTPDQLLHYSYSDCDDRSIFFAYLVRHFMDLPVAGVSWPGHMATIVKPNEAITGDRLRFDNQSWLVCDPTYINANAGMMMPHFRDESARLHPIE